MSVKTWHRFECLLCWILLDFRTTTADPVTIRCPKCHSGMHFRGTESAKERPPALGEEFEHDDDAFQHIIIRSRSETP
jgi:uncharacterized protein (DUF983 family)